MNSTRISFRDFMEQNSQIETQREKIPKPIDRKSNKNVTKIEQTINRPMETAKVINKRRPQIHNVSVQIKKSNDNLSRQKKKKNITIYEKNRKSFDKSFSQVHHLSSHEKFKTKTNQDSQFLQQIVYALDKTIKNKQSKAISYLNKTISYIQYLQCLKLLFMIPEFYEPNSTSTDTVSKFWSQHIAKHTIKKFVQKISIVSCITPPANKQEQQMILLCQPLRKNRQSKILSYQQKNRKIDSLNHSSNSYDTNYERIQNSINLCMVSVGTFEKQGIQDCQLQDIESQFYCDNGNNQITLYNQNKSINHLLTHEIKLFEKNKNSKQNQQIFADKQNQNYMINMLGINHFQLDSKNKQTSIMKQINSTFQNLKSPSCRSKEIQQQFLSTLSKQKLNKNIVGNLRSEKLYQIAKSKSIKKQFQIDKSTDQIQYQKNKNQLTFHPTVNSSILQKKKHIKKPISRAEEASIVRMIRGRAQRQIRKQLKEGKIPFDEKIIDQLKKKKFTQYYNQQNAHVNYSNQDKSIKNQLKNECNNQQQGIVIEILLNDRSQNLIFNYKRQSYETAARKFIQKHKLSQHFYLEKLIEGIKKAENYCITKIQQQLEDAQESDLS